MDDIIKFLKSALRRASQRWKPIYETRNLARRPFTGKSKSQKYEYQCCKCKKYFSRRKVQVDHIVQVGGLSSLEELPGYVERLLCSRANLQLVCMPCHQKKTTAQQKKPRKKP